MYGGLHLCTFGLRTYIWGCVRKKNSKSGGRRRGITVEAGITCRFVFSFSFVVVLDAYPHSLSPRAGVEFVCFGNLGGGVTVVVAVHGGNVKAGKE
jgi:hypothetical protein